MYMITTLSLQPTMPANRVLPCQRYSFHETNCHSACSHQQAVIFSKGSGYVSKKKRFKVTAVIIFKLLASYVCTSVYNIVEGWGVSIN